MTKLYKNSTSGCPGVSLFRRSGKRRAYVRHEGKQIHAGYLTEFDDAVKARITLEKDLAPSKKRPIAQRVMDPSLTCVFKLRKGDV